MFELWLLTVMRLKLVNYPITSYGYLCYYIDINDDIKYLMIQRKDSIMLM